MTDNQLIQSLIDRDERITQQFFFQNCRPLFRKVISLVFSYPVDYDEFVNEFYLYLMENEAYRLRQFQGRSSIYQWLKTVAIRYFIHKRDCMIDMEPQEPLLDKSPVDETVDEESNLVSRLDLEYLLARMTNKRQVYVIRELVLHDAEPREVALALQVTVDNLYNIKKRAIEALTKIAINEAEKYEKGRLEGKEIFGKF